MGADYSWNRSAREYSNLYVNLAQGTRTPTNLAL
jgi:glycogen synthase